MAKYTVMLSVLENQADSYTTSTHRIEADNAAKATEMAITSAKNRWGCIVRNVISTKQEAA